jgi:hypothetical protein
MSEPETKAMPAYSIDPRVLEEIKQSNLNRSRETPYSTETRNAARVLYVVSGWTDARIAESLGIRSRETVTAWAREGHWKRDAEDYKRLTRQKTLEKAAETASELNARLVKDVNGILAKIYQELLRPDMEGKSVEGLSSVAIQGIRLLREIQGLAEPTGNINITNYVRVEHFNEALEAVRDDPVKLAHLMKLQQERIELEGQMRELLDEGGAIEGESKVVDETSG